MSIIDDIISSDYIYIDTSSFLQDTFPLFLERYRDYFIENNKKIIAETFVCYEIARLITEEMKDVLVNNSFEAMNKYPGVIELRNQDLQNDDELIMSVYADRAFIALLAGNFTAKQSIITNDVNLAKNINSLSMMEELDYNISIYKIDKNNGLLHNFDIYDIDDNEKQLLEDEIVELKKIRKYYYNRISNMEAEIAFLKEENDRYKKILEDYQKEQEHQNKIDNQSIEFDNLLKMNDILIDEKKKTKKRIISDVGYFMLQNGTDIFKTLTDLINYY